MTTITIEVPDELLAKVTQQERPIQEVVVGLLKDAFENRWANEQMSIPSEEDAILNLYQTGLLAETQILDDEFADEWDNLPTVEKQVHLDEMDDLILKDSALSRYIIESRR